VERFTPSALPLTVAVCLLALAFASTASTGLAQNKTAQKNEKKPQADKTLSSTSAPVIAVAPKAGSKPSFLSPVEMDIIDEMNLARMEPQRYAAFIEEYRKYYKGNQLTLPGRSKATVTIEGLAAVDEAISFLRTAKPLSAMEVNQGMCLAAKDHANDLALKGVTGHKGSDGSSPNARLERYGSWEGVIGENIVYEVSTPREIVIGLIIDDGTPNRGHRRNIFDPAHRVAGVSITDSPTNGAKCVLNYAGGFQDKMAAPNRTTAPRKL
jgi:uncharacterized protein YkwD